MYQIIVQLPEHVAVMMQRFAQAIKMTKDKLLQLYKQYAHDNMFRSYYNPYDPSYHELLRGGPAILPMVVERLKDSIGHDSGENFDHDNDPWLSITLMDELTLGECTKDMPKEYVGNLNEIRDYCLSWWDRNGDLIDCN